MSEDNSDICEVREIPGELNETTDDAFNDSNLLTSLVKNKKWAEVTDVVANISSALSQPQNRMDVDIEVLNNLIGVLNMAAPEIKAEDPEIITAVTEVFRALKISCVGESRNQKIIVENDKAVDSACVILKSLTSLSNKQENILCIRVGVQFLGNLVVNNNETRPVIWNKCSTILLDLSKYEDERVQDYTSMVIYNILLGCPNITLLLLSSTLDDFIDMVEILIEHAMKDSEFAIFTVQLLVSGPGYLPKLYDRVSGAHRLYLLDLLHSFITGEDKISIPVSSIHFLVERFKSQADCILKTCTDYVETLEPAEVSKLLRLLASACADTEYQQDLQKDKALLITCSMLLTNIHKLGKSGDNNFSVIQKLAELSIKTSKSDIAKHPAFYFKSYLIQMLANLCWRHKDNQDQIRELDCIPVLLDCCNIDARNPMIIQWVVLATRNLCENNSANQAVIANMTQEGVVDAKLLTEMGLTLHADGDNKIVVVPLEKKNSK